MAKRKLEMPVNKRADILKLFPLVNYCPFCMKNVHVNAHYGICPECKGQLHVNDEKSVCATCGKVFKPVTSSYDGTEGQERESCADTQDRENYTVDPELE